MTKRSATAPPQWQEFYISLKAGRHSLSVIFTGINTVGNVNRIESFSDNKVMLF